MQPHQAAHRIDADAFDEGLEYALVEMALAPRSHLVHRLGRIPAALVGALGGDGVIDVAHRAHFCVEADIVAGQFVRVTASVDFFVMMKADVERDLADTLAAEKHFVAGRRVALDQCEFVVGQFARLVEYFERNGHLADVMQEAGHAGLACRIGVEIKLARQRDHQAAHRD